jgi:uncharacterized metal-binding protein YceD (DUF177 family)
MTDPMHASSEDLPVSRPFRVSALPARKPTHFDIAPDKPAQALVAALLGISEVRGMHFKGEIRASGKHDYVLEARLVATVVQPCSVSLAPVTTRIDEPVIRRYLADYAAPEGDEVEMPEDDSSEQLPEVIDAGAVAVEALALALPLYPRAPGAELGEVAVAPPGAAPLRDEDLRPFAGLAALKGKLTGGGSEGGSGGDA